MTEPRRVTVREVGDDVFGHLEVALRAGDVHMPEVGGQRRQEVSERGLLSIPQCQAENCKRVAIIPISE